MGVVPVGTAGQSALRCRGAEDSRGRRPRLNVARPVPALLLVGGVVLAACGSAAAKPTSSPSTTSHTTTSHTSTSHSSATLMVASTKYGKVLESPSGKTLYALTADTATHDACAGACLSIWPPLTVSGSPVAGSGVSSAKLGTLTIAGGKHQVTYNGHPLFFYSGDTSSGQTAGEGLPFPAGSAHPSARWWLVSAAGGYVQHASSGSSSGYGYGSG